MTESGVRLSSSCVINKSNISITKYKISENVEIIKDAKNNLIELIFKI